MPSEKSHKEAAMCLDNMVEGDSLLDKIAELLDNAFNEGWDACILNQRMERLREKINDPSYLANPSEQGNY